MNDDSPPVKSPATHGLYAKVGCSLPDDPKMIDAGDICELVYIRCLLRAREALSDGVVDRRRLPRWCVGIRGNPVKHAARLVEVGLWELHPDGWCIPTDVWSRWNPLATEVQAKRDEEAERKRRFREKKRNESTDVPTGQKRTHGTRDAQPEPETKPEPQGEPETEPQAETLNSSSGSSSVATSPDDDGVIDKIITRCAALRADRRPNKTGDSRAYQQTCITNMQRTERSAIAELLVAKPYLRGQADKAARWYEDNVRTQTTRSA